MTDHLFTDVITLSQDCSVCQRTFSFPKPKRGRYPRYCSDDCRSKVSYRKTVRRECQQCGDLITKKHFSRYCSVKCRNKISAISRRDKGRWNSGTHNTAIKQCRACDLGFKCKTDNDRFLCSEICRTHWRNIQKRVSFTVYRRKKGVFVKGVVVERSVRVCTNCASPDLESNYARLCRGCMSTAEARYLETAKVRSSAKVRRIRMTAAKVEKVKTYWVLNRDDWTCQICGIETPERYRGTVHPQAPEVDHIIPIAMGGEHSYRNVQCACRKCNISKGNRYAGIMRA